MKTNEKLEIMEEYIYEYIKGAYIPEVKCSYDRIRNEAVSRVEDYICTCFEVMQREKNVLSNFKKKCKSTFKPGCNQDDMISTILKTDT